MDLQTLRAWVHRSNDEGLAGCASGPVRRPFAEAFRREAGEARRTGRGWPRSGIAQVVRGRMVNLRDEMGVSTRQQASRHGYETYDKIVDQGCEA